MTIRGVILAAGYGSRFLPATRVVPKELLPILARPAIDYVVSEFIHAGIEEVLVITSRRKRALEDWFDGDPELAAQFDASRLGVPKIRATFVRQTEMRGTGHALMLARSFAGADPIVVAYPDDLFDAAPQNCTAALIETYEATGCSVLSAGDLAGEDVSRYGVIEAQAVDGVLRVRGIVEKPAPGTEPSSLVSWGRYLYTPEIFEALEAGFAAHAGGEFYATDAITALAARGRVVARVIESERHDTGDLQGYLRTVIDAALADPVLSGPLRAWLDTRR